MRPLSSDEQAALLKMAAHMPPHLERKLRADLENSTVSEAGINGSILRFRLEGYHRPTYAGQHAYPVEATVSDADGCELTVVLYADQQDRLLELELIRWGEEDVLAPNWPTLKVGV